MQMDSIHNESWLTKAKVAVSNIVEYLQDRRDYARAIKVLERNEEQFTLEQVKKELGFVT
jgi:hypothetical protein